MKIQGTNQTNFNPYKNHMRQQNENQKNKYQSDQLSISDEAKEMQENNQPNTERAKYVQDIKKEIESGAYRVDPDKTAQKMVDFWSNKQ